MRKATAFPPLPLLKSLKIPLAGLTVNEGVFSLPKVISELKKNGCLPNTAKEIDYYFDQNALALTELYILFHERTAFKLDDEVKLATDELFERVSSFTADAKSLNFLKAFLMDIKNEVSDEDGGREIVELWRESEYFDEWQTHLSFLIKKMT